MTFFVGMVTITASRGNYKLTSSANEYAAEYTVGVTLFGVLVDPKARAGSWNKTEQTSWLPSS